MSVKIFDGQDFFAKIYDASSGSQADKNLVRPERFELPTF